MSARWRLNRAGIVNVYQYENEVLEFAGGRLLLRGVNGSGKSTAMNMLLPFLLTTREGRIDAAGEQSGILKSWMLDGREDPQPVGYLWIEFEQRGGHLVCGCGIRANRSSDSVSTWWFITSKRPGLDLNLVSNGVALSREALRASLDDDDEVFTQHRRREYRRAIEVRLFDGASIDQHIGLLNKVRSPRVGDRIDMDLRDHLVDALPRLSEEALLQAAQPLDDLEEYRHNAEELAKTLEAARGLLDVYRSYCLSDLRRRVAEGRSCLAGWRKSTRDEEGSQRAVNEAEEALTSVNARRDELAGSEKRLRREIEALQKSSAYRDGQELDNLRQLVEAHDQQRRRAAQRLLDSEQSAEKRAGEIREAQRQGSNDLETLNDELARATDLTRSCGLDRSPPAPLMLSESPLPDSDVSEPEAQDLVPVVEATNAAQAAIMRRRAEVDEVDSAVLAEQAAEQLLRQAESRLELVTDQEVGASTRRDSNIVALREARSEWNEKASQWATQAGPLFEAAGIVAPETISRLPDTGLPDTGLPDTGLPDTGLADTGPTPVPAPTAARTEHPAAADEGVEALREALLAKADGLVEHWREALGAVESRLAGERGLQEQAQRVVDELAEQTRPPPPRLDWQRDADCCLAEVIDFADHLDETQRAGLEAALQASGLLSARPVNGGLELADGQLVAMVAQGVASPLSDVLTVTVPERLRRELQEDSLKELLGSISSDLSSDAATCVTLDGGFRVGVLAGRHSKERAEHVGATARAEALAKAREEARQNLEQARSVVEATLEDRSEHRGALERARSWRALLPATDDVVASKARLVESEESLTEARSQHERAKQAVAEAERVHSEASNSLDRLSNTLSLPRDAHELREVRRALSELDLLLTQCMSSTTALGRSVDAWRSAVERWRAQMRKLADERVESARAQNRYEEHHAGLITIEDSIGAQYREVVAAIAGCRAELGTVEARLAEIRAERDNAVERAAQAGASRQSARDRRQALERECETARVSLDDALGAPGYLDAVSEAPLEAPASAGPKGLQEMLSALEPLLGEEDGEHVETTADNVYRSLRARRDSLGAGWDAEAQRPDESIPLTVLVTGPSGRAHLPQQLRAVEQKCREVDGLLNAKQNNALHELLQGLIAREIAEKIDAANRLVTQTNKRLREISTAHGVGVKLRWRRSAELDADAARMVELLATIPDLRTDDDEIELRRTLGRTLQEARSEQPDLSYRQIIAQALDYKQWHDMAVIVLRNGKETRLGRATPLSEGEKKLVTYLPLFAAVAASYDSLAPHRTTPGTGELGIARFVLLDDAFAKVSEDNHAALFGLLVDLDLDFVATSERLWGTHRTVPELAITEVVRDASHSTILLERYLWDGSTLERQGRR